MAFFDVIADNLRFPEAPVAMADGAVLFVEIAAGRVQRLQPWDGQVGIVAAPGGGPNGLALGPKGKLYCCNNGGLSWIEGPGSLRPHLTAADYSGGRIERIDIGTGKVETLYRSGDRGIALRGPNDLVFDRHGGFYFTDFGKMRERERDTGSLLYAKADGSFIAELVHPMDGPNGVGLSPNGKILYVAETFTGLLWAFAVTAPGRLGRGRQLYRLPRERYFDSLAVEAGGNICVGTLGKIGGITIVSPKGVLVDFIASPDRYTTNIAFGGDDMRCAWVTFSERGALARATWPRPGLRLAY